MKGSDMEILQVRPARVSAALVAIGDMLVTSPIGADGPRPSRWLGAVTEHVIVEDVHDRIPADPAAWRQWRIALVDGQNTETAVVPADGWVWVHLPMVDLPAPAPAPAKPRKVKDEAQELLDSIPERRSILPEVCGLPDCGCSGLAHE